MATDKILINVTPGETRIALLEKDRLSELLISRLGQASSVGNIYLGRVSAVLNGLQAAFIDYGVEKAGFLSLADLRSTGPKNGEKNNRERIADYLSEGDEILVQVSRDPEENKGAKLTARVTLTGRDLVFAPGQSGITLSRRITDMEERKRLLDLVGNQVPANLGGAFIVRVAAQEAEAEDLESEIKRMILWSEKLEAARKKAKNPSCLHQELEPAFLALREHGGVDLEAVKVDDKNLYERLREFASESMHDLTELIDHHSEAKPIFDSYGVEELIDGVLEPLVPLPSGGNIIISETPALTAIDVNTGSGQGAGREQLAMTTNQEAAEEISRQVLLRNLSGLLVIDFVNMRKKQNLENIQQSMKRHLGKDAVRPHIVGFTKLGLLEITRRRRGASLSEILSGKMSKPEKSIETIRLEIFRSLIKELSVNPESSFEVHAAPEVVDAISIDKDGVRKSLEKKYGFKIALIEETNNRRDNFYIRPPK